MAVGKCQVQLNLFDVGLCPAAKMPGVASNDQEVIEMMVHTVVVIRNAMTTSVMNSRNAMTMSVMNSRNAMMMSVMNSRMNLMVRMMDSK